MPPVIEATGVDYAYHSGSASPREALRQVSFSIERGELIALIGTTGSGKSTLLQLTAGLLLPQSGRARILDTELSSPKLTEKELDALRRKVVISLQRPEDMLFETYLGDDVAYGPRNYGLKGNQLALTVRSAMERVGLSYSLFKDRRCDSLSGGEKRKGALAGVLALEPEILLLDEPAAGLDAASARELFHLVLSIRGEGRTVIYSTHDMNQASLADRVGLFSGGRLEALLPPGELFADGKLLSEAGLLPPSGLLLRNLLADAGLTPGKINAPADPEETAQMIAALFTGGPQA
jgi:energy-coupling factor transporter ATP-binding protein EcfA2